MTLYELHRYIEEAISEFGSEVEVYFDSQFNELMLNLGGGVKTTIVELNLNDD